MLLSSPWEEWEEYSTSSSFFAHFVVTQKKAREEWPWEIWGRVVRPLFARFSLPDFIAARGGVEYEQLVLRREKDGNKLAA